MPVKCFKVQNKDMFLEKCNYKVKIKTIALLIFLGVFLANPGNVISFDLLAVKDSFRLGLTPLITMLSGILLGPFLGLLLGFLIDFISVALWHGLAQYFYSFGVIVMIRAFLAGYVYHYFFKELSLKAVTTAITVSYIVTSVLLTPFALNYHYGIVIYDAVIQRLTLQGLAIPVYVILAYMLLQYRKKSLDLLKVHKKLEIQANTDELTGLPNRRIFITTLKKYISRAKRHKSALALIYIDLDDFKYLNDSFGHIAGDKFLAAVGELLQSEVRREDLSARLGGDEFAVVLCEVDIKHIEDVTERILQGIKNINIDENQRAITASIGLASLKQEDDYESFISRADEAMYTAKVKGEGHIQKSPELTDNIIEFRRP